MKKKVCMKGEERRRGELLMEKKRDQAPAYIP